MQPGFLNLGGRDGNHKNKDVRRVQNHSMSRVENIYDHTSFPNLPSRKTHVEDTQTKVVNVCITAVRMVIITMLTNQFLGLIRCLGKRVM